MTTERPVRQEAEDRALGRTALHLAIGRGDIDAARRVLTKRLLQLGPHPLINIPDRRGETPLHYVVLYSHSWELEPALKVRRAADLLRMLLELKANPNIGDVDGLTPLHEAAALNQVWISSLLIHFGANVNAPAGPSVYNETALHCAAGKRGRHVAPLLIEAGASVDAADSNGQTPLHYAVRKANEDMIR